jgi:hypothetical protein
MLCRAEGFYGHSQAKVSITTTVSEDGFSTEASTIGNGAADDFFQEYGTFTADFAQTYDFRVLSNVSLDVSGVLWHRRNCDATVTVSGAEGTIAFYEILETGIGCHEELSRTFEEQVPLAPGDYRIAVDVEARPGQMLACWDGSASAQVDVQFVAPTSVEPPGSVSWSRLKSLYR